MFCDNCTERGQHGWTNWEWCPQRQDGTRIPTDPHDGSYNESATFYYRRECQLMGCDAVECAETLWPAGRHALVDTKSTDKAIAELKELKGEKP